MKLFSLVLILFKKVPFRLLVMKLVIIKPTRLTYSFFWRHVTRDALNTTKLVTTGPISGQKLPSGPNIPIASTKAKLRKL